jgi:hypothetical protein
MENYIEAEQTPIMEQVFQPTIQILLTGTYKPPHPKRSSNLSPTYNIKTLSSATCVQNEWDYTILKNTYVSITVRVRSFLLGTILIYNSCPLSNLEGSVKDS